MALVALFEGTYNGTWTNTTFGSTGPIKFEVKLDRTARTVTTTLTLGGNVFGAPAPPPETMTNKVDSALAGGTTKSAIFGDLTVTLAGTTVTMKGTNLPSARASTFQATGTITNPSTLNFDYTVGLKDGTEAKGKISLTK